MKITDDQEVFIILKKLESNISEAMSINIDKELIDPLHKAFKSLKAISNLLNGSIIISPETVEDELKIENIKYPWKQQDNKSSLINQIPQPLNLD